MALKIFSFGATYGDAQDLLLEVFRDHMGY